jgi:hypothetical protein
MAIWPADHEIGITLRLVWPFICDTGDHPVANPYEYCHLNSIVIIPMSAYDSKFERYEDLMGHDYAGVKRMLTGVPVMEIPVQEMDDRTAIVTWSMSSAFMQSSLYVEDVSFRFQLRQVTPAFDRQPVAIGVVIGNRDGSSKFYVAQLRKTSTLTHAPPNAAPHQFPFPILPVNEMVSRLYDSASALEGGHFRSIVDDPRLAPTNARQALVHAIKATELDLVHAECSICIEKLRDGGSDLLVAQCEGSSKGHAYHKTCLVDWMKQQQTCPECRQLLKYP